MVNDRLTAQKEYSGTNLRPCMHFVQHHMLEFLIVNRSKENVNTKWFSESE